MKTMILALSLLLCATAFATETQSVDPSTLMSIDNSAQPQVSTCYAYTICPQGNTIWCRVWGGAYSACTWYVVPYRAVHCEGNDAYGNWQIYNVTCD